MDTFISPIHHMHLKSMCEAFCVICTQQTIERYMCPSMIHIRYQKELNLLVQKYPQYWYIDKLWVVQKGGGKGTRYFSHFLKQSTKPLIWRTNKEHLRKWYLRFEDVKQIANYDGYWYFIHSNPQHKMSSWSFEDLHLFHHPSYTTYTDCH